MSTTLLYARDLATGYGGRRGRTVSRDIGLELREGELISLVGPNGCGKSTMLKTLGGIQAPLAGEIMLGDRSLHHLDARSRARELAVVLAARVETGHLLVRTLVSLGRYPYTGRLGRLREEDRRMVEWALRSVGGETLADRYVDELSDGEYQRIMIARALAQQPRLILLDEPAAFLDLMKRVEIMHLLKRISRDSGASFIVASHDLEMVMAVSDRVWLLDREGVVHDGSPEDHVLDKTLERVFRSPYVHFDRRRGGFRHVSQEQKPVARLYPGPGMEAADDEEQMDLLHWSRVALERMGFHVEEGRGESLLREPGPQVEVRVERTAGKILWRLLPAAEPKEAKSTERSREGRLYSSIAALSTAIRDGGRLESR